MKKPADAKSKKAPKRKVDARLKELLAAARRMERMVRAENRRWGLPLIVMKDGKICNVPA